MSVVVVYLIVEMSFHAWFDRERGCGRGGEQKMGGAQWPMEIKQ